MRGNAMCGVARRCAAMLGVAGQGKEYYRKGGREFRIGTAWRGVARLGKARRGKAWSITD